MRMPDFEHVNEVRPSTGTVKYLRNNRLIYPGSPHWWSTDYAPDPREYVPFPEFKTRLVTFGLQETKPDEIDSYRRRVIREVHLYPYEQVPMSVVELQTDPPLSFLITARPFHPKERQFS